MTNLYYNNKKLFSLIAILMFCLQLPAKAQVLFEGYYKILVGNSHVGYTVQKYEYDKKKQQYISIYYIKTNELGGNLTESLKAYSNKKLQPISYQYTSQKGSELKTIDATFKNENMNLKISNGKVSNTSKSKIKKGTFLSTFLGYLMLKNGISKGKKFTYNAIAEEEGKSYGGESLIESEHKGKAKNITAYKIYNKYKNMNFISLINERAEVISTTSPLQKVSTELVKTPADATSGFTLNNKHLTALFGSIPAGKINYLHRN